MREKGLEPSRTFVHMNLNHTRLPVPPSPHIKLSLNSLVEKRALWKGHLRCPKLFARYLHRTILTAAPFRPYCICHRQRAGSMLPIPPPLHTKEPYFNIVTDLCQQIKVENGCMLLSFFLYFSFINNQENQHLIQQVFNVSWKGRFFTDAV